MDYLNLIFAGISALCALYSCCKAKEIRNSMKNIVKGKNNSVGEINNEKIVYEEHIQQKIVNDEKFIKEISASVAQKLIEDNKIEFSISDDGVLSITTPEYRKK